MQTVPFRSSRRLAEVQAPIIPVIADLVRRHPGTISLGQGVVSYGPPAAALQAARQFGERPDQHRYGPVQGQPELLERIARKLAVENGLSLGPERRLLVTAGANMAFLNAVLAIADPGDEVILPLPYYFNQEMAVRMIGCVPVTVPTRPDFQLDLDALAHAITPRTRAIVTVSPNNPTGAVYPEADLRAVNRLCREAGIYHIADEAYEYFTWEGARHFSPAAGEGSEAHTLTLHSLSKAYGMASWRIGYLVLPAHLEAAVLKVQDTNLICAPGISQAAAAAALAVGKAYCAGHLQSLAEVRLRVLEQLEPLRDHCRIPAAEGAFYLLLRVETALDSLSLAERLIREHGVAVIPGAAFGLTEGCHLRIAYGALERETLGEGIRRLTQGLQALTTAHA